MRLREALTRVSALAGPEAVALVGGPPGRVLTCRGPILASVVVDPDDTVPWGLVEGRALGRALRDVPGELRAENDGTAIVVRGAGALARLPTVEAPMPSLPARPPLVPVPDWAIVAQVIHAAGSGADDRPELRCVRFGPDVTEATDAIRSARAWIGLGSGELVPATAFARFPHDARQVSVAFKSRYAWFQGDEELRIVELAEERWFPSLEPVFHEDPTLTRIHVPRKPLERAISRAFRASPIKAVHLRLVGGQHESARDTPHATVSRLATEQDASFEALIEAEGDGDFVFESAFDGRRISEALKALSPDRVTIAYSRDPCAPIRFEADRYVEVLYPRIKLAPGGHA